MNEIAFNEPELCRLKSLLNSFNLLPHEASQKTYMDVAGYPHYENVVSNVLAFYLDPKEEHGLGDLVLTSLLRVLGSETAGATHIDVVREHDTPKGGRLDLLIKGEGFTIGIENKIYASVYNDLADYGAAIDWAANRADMSAHHCHKVVLSLRKEAGLTSGFKCVTHDMLWTDVQTHFGHYAAKGQAKWVIYLLDFIQNMAHLGEGTMGLNQNDQFFIDNHTEIEKFNERQKVFKKRLFLRIQELEGLTKDFPTDRPPYVYSSDRLVFDMGLRVPKEEPTTSFDLFLYGSGWQLELFGRGDEAYQGLLKLVEDPRLKDRMAHAESIDRGRRWIVRRWLYRKISRIFTMH